MDSMETDTAEFDPVALGLALGTVLATTVGLVGVLSRAGYAERWRALFADVYPGFEAEEGGTFLGIVWGGIDGFVFGVAIGRLYNAYRHTVG